MQVESIHHLPPDGVSRSAYDSSTNDHVFSTGTTLDHDSTLSVLSDAERIQWCNGSGNGTHANVTLERNIHHTNGYHDGWNIRIIQSIYLPSSRLSQVELIDPTLCGIGGIEAIIRGGSSGGGKILEAKWAKFSNFREKQPETMLCVLQEESIHILNSEGSLSTVQLPFKAKRLWQLLEGLIVERLSEPIPENTDLLSEDEEVVAPPEPAPIFFSLLHPLEELKPVSRVERIFDGDSEEETFTQEEWICDGNEQIVYTCPTQPFVMTWNSLRRQHSLWLIRQSRREISNRLKLDGNSALTTVVEPTTASLLALPHDTTISAMHSAAPSRRASQVWHPTNPHHLTPTHPSHTRRGKAKAVATSGKAAPGDTKDFYQQFLRSSLDAAEGPVVQPAYYTAAAHRAYTPLNHDDEDDPDAIHSELLFERSWSQEDQAEHPADRVFLACDEESRPLLCMFTQASELLQVFRLSSTVQILPASDLAPELHVPMLQLEFAFSRHVRSACSIYSSWHHSFSSNHDPYHFSILTLEQDGRTVTIRQGEHEVCKVDVPVGQGSSINVAALPDSINSSRGGAALVGTPMKHDLSFASANSGAFFSPPSRSPSTVGGRTPAVNAQSAADVTIIDLCDSVSNRVTLLFSDGSQSRIALPTRYVSTLVHTCMNAWACSVSPAMLQSLRSDLIVLRSHIAQRERQRQQATIPSNTISASSVDPPRAHSILPTDEHEWSALVALMRRLIGYSNSSKSSAAASFPTPSGDAAWQQLLVSKFHRSRSALSGTSFSIPVAPVENIDPVDWSAIRLTTIQSSFLTELPAIFLCLHLVYEDFKVPVVAQSASASSAASHGESPSALLVREVLKPLAIVQGRKEYLDYYWRELSSGSNAGAWAVTEQDRSMWSTLQKQIPSAAASIVPSTPPSIHAFLSGMLQNDASKSTAGCERSVYPLPVLPSANDPQSHMHPFLLDSSFSEPFAWSRKILLFYDLLTTRRSDGAGGEELLALQNTHSAAGKLPGFSSFGSTLSVPAASGQHDTHTLAPPQRTSSFLQSPYALESIERAQVELAIQHAPPVRSASSRGIAGGAWSTTTSAAATPAHGSMAANVATPAPGKQSLFTPRTPATGAAASGHHILLSPLTLTSPFPSALSPFTGVGKHSMSDAKKIQQHLRVHAMHLQAASTAAAIGAGTISDHMETDDPTAVIDDDDPLRTPMHLRPGGTGAVKRKPRVSFGANTTVGTVGTARTCMSAGSVRMTAVASEYPVFTPSAPVHPTPLFLSHSSAEAVVLAMVSEEVTLDRLALLHPGVALPLLECLKQVREHPPVTLQHTASFSSSTDGTTTSVSSWPKEAYMLIGREDLGKMFASLQSNGSGSGNDHPDSDQSLDAELDLASGRPGDTELEKSSSSSSATLDARTGDQPDLDGTLLVQREAALRFGQDMRLKEVRHLLRSDRVLCVSLDAATKQEIESGSAEASVENQVRLGIVAKRTLSLPIARGMYTLSSITPVLTDSLPIPPFVLRCRLPPLNSIVELDLAPGNSSGLTPAHMRWPDFHNGVAAALRVQSAVLPPSTDGGMRDESASSSLDDTSRPDASSNLAAAAGGSSAASLHQITRTWIMYNRPSLQAQPTPAAAPGAASSAAGVKGGLSYQHAGFLFGLGLTGHLNCLSASDFFWYLSQNHEPTAVAMLLGMAACRRGTADTTVSKMLTLHVPALLPQNFSEMNIPSVVQSSALLGLGMLYQGSCHRLMAELLLNEIGRKPDRFKTDESFLLERENYALSAGLGLGLLLLARGADAHAMSSLADLQVDKKLSLYIHGGKDLPSTHPSSHDSAHSAGSSTEHQEDGSAVGWMHNSTNRRATSTNPASSVGAATQRSTANQAAAAANAKNGRIKEGALVNVDVTSPGATLALAFMYMHSHNSLIAARVSIPDTHFLLDYVRSDFLFLRTLAKHLIMWNDVPTTMSELLEEPKGGLTALLTNHVLSIGYYFPKDESRDGQKQRRKKSSSTGATTGSQQEESKYANDIDVDMIDGDGEGMANAPESVSVADDDESDPDDPSDSVSAPLTLPASAISGADNDIDVDYATLRQAYIFVLSASCFAMGLKYAGTCDRRILKVLIKILSSLRAVAKKRGGGDFIKLMLEGLNPQCQLHKVDRGTLDSALVAVATSISLLMCGSGNLQVLKLLRSLYKIRPEKTTPAGWYVSISMCIGFVFLGGGRFTLDTGGSGTPTSASQANIAYLVISLFPHLAFSIDDQRYFLSVYRHLYVLATTQRGIQTIDVDTGFPCYVPLEVIVQQGRKQINRSGMAHTRTSPKLKRLRFITPCLLPPYDTIHRISIVSARFHALSIQLKQSGSSTCTSSSISYQHLQQIFVKKKLAYESYEKDPKGLRSILSRTFPKNHALVSAALGGDGESRKGGVSKAEFLRSFSSEPRLLTFTGVFIRSSFIAGELASIVGPSAIASTNAVDEFMVDVLYECLSEEKFFEMIQIYLQLFPVAHEREDGGVQEDSNYHRMLSSKLADGKFMWSLLLLKQYYESTRQGADTPVSSSTSLPASSRSTTASSFSHTPRPFHTLPLAEGSAGVDLADAEQLTSSIVSRAKPLLSNAFLDAIIGRVDSFFMNHQPLQRAFASYVQQVASDPRNPALTAVNPSVSHPLLGSLLLYWSIPDVCTLHAGLVTLRQYTAGGASVSIGSFQLIVGGVIWPNLHTKSIQAILQAIKAAA